MAQDRKRSPASASRLPRVTHDDPLLDTPAAADYLGYKPHTLENNRSKREPGKFIPYVKINGAVRYRKSTLDQKIDAGEVRE